VVVGVVSHRSTTQLIEASSQRAQAYKALDAVSDTQLALRGIALALRGYLITGQDAHLEALKSAEAGSDRSLENLRSLLGSDAAQSQQVDRLRSAVQVYLLATNAMAEARRTKGPGPAAEMFLADDTRGALTQLEQALNGLQQQLESALQTRIAQVAREGRLAQWTIIGGNLLALVLAALAGALITRNISSRLQALTAATERVTAGDLNVTVGAENGPDDEIGVLTRALGRMTQSLRALAATAEQIALGDLRAKVIPQSGVDVLGNSFARMSGDLRDQIRELINGATVLGSASSEIVASSSQLAASATQSAAAVSETTTTVEEVRQTAQLASQKARLVSDSAQKSVEISDNGRRSTQDVEAGMARIRRQMELIAASMAQLSEQGHAVGNIIATVEDISIQSNLLAVNAAIEAAKAGEHGKGFGVVAQEIKSLAEQSRQATTQVRSILSDVQKATAAAVMATEEGGKVVDAGMRQSEASGKAIQALGGSVNDAAQAALQIAASSQQQLVGVDQVAAAMESIKQASEQNAVSAKQLETTARSLNELGQRLQQMVGRYKV
ncbi:MAG: methyl-accepting chemotaxis protein, partial [Burkholderiaceae bacterium]